MKLKFSKFQLMCHCTLCCMVCCGRTADVLWELTIALLGSMLVDRQYFTLNKDSPNVSSKGPHQISVTVSGDKKNIKYKIS